jgi:hypothetical protein
MGGVMIERRNRDEGSLSAGLLAERMVLALGRVLRENLEDPVTDEDKMVLAKARDIFQTMASRDVLVFGPRASRMLDDGSYFDALDVVELEAGDEVEERATKYAEVLDKLVNGIGPTEAEKDDVRSLRRLFLEMGETTLARMNEASRAPQDVTWRPTKQPTLYF